MQLQHYLSESEYKQASFQKAVSSYAQGEIDSHLSGLDKYQSLDKIPNVRGQPEWVTGGT